MTQAVELLHQDYFNVFGVSDDFLSYFDAQKELLELEIERAITKDKFLGTRINLIKIELQKKNLNKRKSDVYEVKGYVEKYLQTHLNPKITTVREFYSYLDLMKKNNGKD